MTDSDYLATIIMSEAANQPYEGQVAVARVLANRMALKFFCDGTPAGLIAQKDQFSGFWFEMISGKYTRVCSTSEEALARAEQLCAVYQAQAGAWAKALQAAADGALGSAYAGSAEWDALAADPRALLYLNPSIVDPLPAWASPAAQLAVIGAHTFYRG